MSLDDFMEGIHILQNNYNRELSKDQLKLYFENLQDISKTRFIENIKQEIKTNRFMPNIAQLRNESNKNYCNYKQRDYSELDFNKFYSN